MATNLEAGPRCGECRLGLGVHNTADPLCDHHEPVVPDDVEAWLARVDAAEAAGVDPFCAVVDADRAMRDGLQASLDRD